jgi:hypothetical protein
MMYAVNTKAKGWREEVTVIVWGATARLAAVNEAIQGQIALAAQAGDRAKRETVAHDPGDPQRKAAAKPLLFFRGMFGGAIAAQPLFLARALAIPNDLRIAAWIRRAFR